MKTLAPVGSCWDRIAERKKSELSKEGLFESEPEKHDAAYKKILIEELPEGSYELLGDPGMRVYTGKMGYIEYEISLIQKLREMLSAKK
jgi:hypothetical protein